ncbi:MAG: DUF4304 domain-containing protein [Burkholderiaceae bacterium]
MKTPGLPPPEAKSGVKIDYVAKRLGLALAPLGFKRKGRQFMAGAGIGDAQHWQIVQLQADKWNEGPRGGFFVNLAVQFPAITRLIAQRPGMDFMREYADKVDESLGQARERLGPLLAQLPRDHPCARPGHRDEFRFRSETDLAALADEVVRSTVEVGLPWLRRFAELRALAESDGSTFGASFDVRIAAAMLLGDRDRAQQHLAQGREHLARASKIYLDSMRTWCAGLGLDVSMFPGEPAPQRPTPSAPRRADQARAESAAHAGQAATIFRGPAGATASPAALAQAWVAEHRARWLEQPKPLVDLPSGRAIAALAEADRQAVLPALLQLAVDAERAAAPREAGQDSGDAFDLDESLRVLIGALLAAVPAPSLDTALAVLAAMRSLVTRWRQDPVTGGYPWGFAALAQWLAGPPCAPHRAALQPGVAAWLEEYARFSLRSFEQMSAWLAAERAKPLDPANPIYELLLEAREREQEMLAKAAAPSDDELRRRIGEYPEQRMAADDKRGVLALRQLAKRDAASGRLPLQWDGDDWGAACRSSWVGAGVALRNALAPMLQDFLEGVDTRPPQRWQRALDARIAALPSGETDAARAWLLQRLADFETCSGRSEWATTGARPGVGAMLGEDSEKLLRGLMWWAWRDAAIAAPALAAALQRVSSGAWLRLPEVGARAPSVGGLALRMLAGLGPDARDGVAALALERGVPKQLEQAVQRALKEPLARA